jgi:alkylation response protein AidB-like acyl-CoA dehydrogenase
MAPAQLEGKEADARTDIFGEPLVNRCGLSFERVYRLIEGSRGVGFTLEHNLQLYYKRAKASEIMFGDANHHREEIARKVVYGDKD